MQTLVIRGAACETEDPAQCGVLSGVFWSEICGGFICEGDKEFGLKYFDYKRVVISV